MVLLLSLLSFFPVFLTLFLFDFLFRGLEKMEAIALRFVVMRGVATALTFVLIHSDRDVLLIPLLDTLGTLIAALMVLPQLRRLGLHAGAGLRLAFTKIGNDFWVIRLK